MSRPVQIQVPMKPRKGAYVYSTDRVAASTGEQNKFIYIPDAMIYSLHVPPLTSLSRARSHFCLHCAKTRNKQHSQLLNPNLSPPRTLYPLLSHTETLVAYLGNLKLKQGARCRKTTVCGIEVRGGMAEIFQRVESRAPPVLGGCGRQRRSVGDRP